MNEQIIGRCSICGSDIVVRRFDVSPFVPPVPRCKGCSAVEPVRRVTVPRRRLFNATTVQRDVTHR